MAEAFISKRGKLFNIKSIQKGETIMLADAVTASATIESIDPAKSVLIITGIREAGGGSSTVDLFRYYCSGEITNATTLTFTRNMALTSSYSHLGIAWIVIEFDYVKSKQAGVYMTPTSVTAPEQSETININPVNPEKSILFYSFSPLNRVTNRERELHFTLTQNTANTLLFRRKVSATTDNVNLEIKWQLIEFN